MKSADCSLLFHLPSHGLVASSSSNTATDSYSWSSYSLSGLFSLEYAPATNVVLFTLGRLGFSKTIVVFDVYNAPDGKIWEETSKASLSMVSSTGGGYGNEGDRKSQGENDFNLSLFCVLSF